MNQEYSTKWWAAFTCIAFLEAILLIMLLSGKTSVELLVAIVVVAMLLFLIPRLDDVVSFTFDRGNFETKLGTINKKIATAKARTDKLVLLSMSKSMYDNLKRIGSGNFGPYKMNDILEREIYYLRDIGYIDNVERIRSIPYEGNNLSDYLKITDAGKQFIELRKSIEEESSK
ncbi:MAG: hypothetical protein DSM106950_15630 [Stigonema ocellatum SAG 48.90 = DSM 106950]|nr:hypothetical protein [Stigonema ocellatum SAG 48.90 = DSM 106950]